MKLRVLHISDTYEGGGAESVFRDTLKISKELGFISDFYISNGKTNPFSYIFSIKNYFDLKEKLNVFQPDIVHIHNYYHYLSPSILKAIKSYKKNKTCKVIYTAHDYHLICPNSGLQYFNKKNRINFKVEENKFNFTKKYDHRSWAYSFLKLFQYIFNYKLMKSHNIFDLIISPSNFLRDIFVKNNIICPITVVRNPIDTSSIIGKKYTNLIKPKKIVLIGRLSPEKGFYEFIKKVNNEVNDEIIFNIYGKGEMEQSIKNINLKPNITVIFNGQIPRDRLIQEISKNDIFCLPSLWYENAPISIIEAASAGLPVLVPNYGGLKEMAQETSNYYFFKYNENINTILKNITPGNSINIEKYTYKKYKTQLYKIYTTLLPDKK